MTSAFNSTLSWLDSSEHERRAVLELVSALGEPGILDELGIGSVRDTIADILSPGTSTIQTRARYFLFIPWILQMVEDKHRTRAEQATVRLQLELCEALDSAHGANAGVIGREAGDKLQRWPISIYWLGLERWGIRRFAGTIQSYYSSLRQPRSCVSGEEIPVEGIDRERDEAVDHSPGNWARLPKSPKDFPKGATFMLTVDEAHFLRERITIEHSHSYLAHILTAGYPDPVLNAETPWDCHASDTASHQIQAWLLDARLFSLVHRGAALLYNLMLAEALDHEERLDGYARDLHEWSGSMKDSQADLENWDRMAMKERVVTANPGVRTSTIDFTDRWHELATTAGLSSIVESIEARGLIRRREYELKGSRARLHYPEALGKHRGYPSSERLLFRWRQVRRVAADILEPLRGDDV